MNSRLIYIQYRYPQGNIFAKSTYMYENANAQILLLLYFLFFFQIKRYFFTNGYFKLASNRKLIRERAIINTQRDCTFDARISKIKEKRN